MRKQEQKRRYWHMKDAKTRGTRGCKVWEHVENKVHEARGT